MQMNASRFSDAWACPRDRRDSFMRGSEGSESAPGLEYRGYRLELVFQRLAPALRNEIIRFWVADGVLEPEEMQRRVVQVVYIARNSKGEIAAVCTAYLGDFARPENRYWFLRMYVRRADRGAVWGLHRFLLQCTFAYLKHHPVHSTEARGTMLVTINEKLWRPAIHRGLKRMGWSYHGKGPRGNEIWFWHFDGSNEIVG